MYKCLVWGLGEEFIEYSYLLQQYEEWGIIRVCGLTDRTVWTKVIGNWKVFSIHEIDIEEYDLVIIFSQNYYKSIKKSAIEYGFDKNVIISYSILFNPLLDISKYLQIQKNVPSIFVNNCWGGLTYHSFNLPFMSPFINMFLSEEDYLKFLNNPKKYIDCDLELDEMISTECPPYVYPRVKCDDILLCFNHDSDFNEAKEKWNRRKKRVNFDNLLVVAYSDNIEFVKKFINLPYKKKLCFVPFEIDNEICFNVPMDNNGKAFYKYILDLSKGKKYLYKIEDLLLEGKAVSYTIKEQIQIEEMKVKRCKEAYEKELLKLNNLIKVVGE